MLLKYNVANIKHNHRLLDIKPDSTQVFIGEDGFAQILFETSLPHKLSVGDEIYFTRSILTANTYTEALELIEGANGELIQVLTPETEIVENPRNKENESCSTCLLPVFPDIEIIHPAGYYQIIEDCIKLLNDDVASELLLKYNTMNDKLKVLYEGFTPTTFSVGFETFKPIYVNEIREGEETSIIQLTQSLPFPLIQGDKLLVKRRIWSYNEVDEVDGIFYFPVKEEIFDYIGYDYIKNEYTGKAYKWSFSFDDIECIYINRDHFQAPIAQIFTEDHYVVVDDRFVSKVDTPLIIDDTESEEEIPNGVLMDGISVYEYSEYLNITLPLTSSNMTELNDEEIANLLFKEKKEELIPDIIDYEKRCFTPYYKENSGKLTPLDSIKFNLFLRDRSESNNWTSNDAMGWNQYKLSGSTFTANEVITDGDLIGTLNFTDEDIYYRKKKVSKTFLRLSFYDSTDPLKQMLLFYSTIFLDANELYDKYIKNIDIKLQDKEAKLVDFIDRTVYCPQCRSDFGRVEKVAKCPHCNYTGLTYIINDNTLTTSFIVNDRFIREKSSEGFYLYLFPDGIADGKERTIYMKAEFNHAGYGITLPLIYPNNGAYTVDFNNKSFPTSLVDLDNGSLKEYYRQLFIPVKIKYDSTVKDYIYYFPICNKKDDMAILNLYEPRINPVGEITANAGNPDIPGPSPDDNITSQDLVVTPRVITLEPGDTKQLKAMYSKQENGKTTTVDKAKSASWSLSTPNIATVSNTGLVTAKKNGSTVITASYEGMSDSCTVYVESYQPEYYNIYVDKKGNITRNSDVLSLPCDIAVDVKWIGSVYFDDNYDGDQDRREQTGGTEVNLFKAGSTNLLRSVTPTGGNNFNSWVEIESITGPTTYEFQYNRDNYKITWQ